MSAAALVTAAGAWFDACANPAGPSGNAPPLPTVNGAVSGNTVLVTVDSSSPLSNAGSAVLVQSSLGLLLVAHTAAGAFTALASTCTHQACTISGFDHQRYVCPCHGSTFDTSGRVLSGPAPFSLRQFATQFNAGVLTITT